MLAKAHEGAQALDEGSRPGGTDENTPVNGNLWLSSDVDLDQVHELTPSPGEKREAAPDFLSGGGQMGAHMRAHDWSGTPFGDPASWPQSLRSALSICLGTSFPIAIYWGEELALLYNDAWSPIPGEKHPGALGRPGREVWPEIWDQIGPLFEKVQATGEGVWQEDQLLPMRRHGYTEECYFNFTFSPIRGEDGSVEGIFNAVVETTFRVISERRERVLRVLAERMATARSEQDLFEIAAPALAGSSADFPFCLLYRLINEDTAELVGIAGIKPGAAVAPPVVRLADGSAAWPFGRIVETSAPEIVPGLSKRFGASVASGIWPEPVGNAYVVPIAALSQPTAIAGFLVAGINPRRELDAKYRAFIERAAGHIGTALANARAYEDQRKRAEAFAAIDQAKTLFFSNVSHEFRTPLTLMLGPLEDSLAQADRLPADERERVVIAHRNGMRLLKLVNSLLDFSRIEAGRFQASFESTDLAAYTAELASSFRSATERAGLSLVVDCPPLPQPVYVDREMWEKIVLNLLSNAFKFTFDGEIAIKLLAAGRNAELIVRDTGVGIPQQELSRVFERFHRIEGSRGRSFEGSGIGLALVQELVKLHGGAIRVESEEGRRTAFIISLPFGTEHLPKDHLRSDKAVASTGIRAQAYVEEALRWLSTENGSGRSATGREVLSDLPSLRAAENATVLLADDNADMRDYVRRLLASAGLRTEVAVDGQAALESARRIKPDLILSDIMMPRLDGLGLLRAVRDDEDLRMVPVILLSARAGEEAEVQGLDAGADDYLVKPFSARELLARVQNTIILARTRREAAERERELRLTAESAEAKLRDLNATLEARVKNALADHAAAEEQLRQAQKMEAIGHLTGGVAHDFNNLLTIVIGNIESLQRHMPAGAPDRLRRSAENAMQGAKRAATLTQRLLAFSRRQPLEPKPVDLNKLVSGMSDLLRGTLGESVELQTVLAGGLWRVEIDYNQLENSLINLAVNARDAMPKGGKLIVETANAHLDEGYTARETEVMPGQYVVIAVSDTGSGISGDVLERVFEPFFTTKPTGHGTGLGLSQVYGFVKQSGGHVKIYSEPGEGTTVKIYLPRFTGANEEDQLAADTIPDGNGMETVLVVENDDGVREHSSEILQELGYRVIEAHDGVTALTKLEENNSIDLLFTDVGLPGINGRELAEEARKRRPRLKVLFTTGYARNAIVHHGRLDAGVEMISKPFTYADLAAKVRKIIDSAS
jgi:signal transduction histidine kinase